MPYRILFVSAEYAPLAKSGGLADVSAALTRYLHAAGHDVRVFMPLYRGLAREVGGARAVPALADLTLRLGATDYRYAVVTGEVAGSALPLYFVDCPALFDRERIYGSEPDEHRRFLFLTRAAFECSQRLGFAPHVLHCNDWHTAMGPLFLRSLYGWDRLFAATKSVLTIHNIGYQGVFDASDAGALSLGDAESMLHAEERGRGRINSLLHGILYADLVTTVSPTYAREICTPEYGAGLEGYLRARGAGLVGILNGVDYAEWNPAVDRFLPVHYSAGNLAGKATLRAAFAARLGLEVGPGTLLAGLVSRLVEQKGIELLLPVLGELLATRDVAFVALGSGEPALEEGLAALARAFPRRVHFERGHNEPHAHWIEAASDVFLMPSRYEPCGLNQLYSLKYGTVPIVRRTGGLADSVSMYAADTGTGTGIVFNDFDLPAVRWALDTALELHARPEHWQRLVANGMRADFSWERQGALYVEEYRRLVGPG